MGNLKFKGMGELWLWRVELVGFLKFGKVGICGVGVLGPEMFAMEIICKVNRINSLVEMIEMGFMGKGGCGYLLPLL